MKEVRMIKKLRLKFFQSWKDVELIFKEGLNIIIGSSNSGKSALLRAIYWVIENRPSGNSFVNHSQLKNGNIEGEVFVEIETEKGVVKRSKNKNFNGYFINDKKLEAIGLSVPEEVERFFNFSEVNIQKQLDSPFLLSQSGGEIARFFNKVLKLDVIDEALKRIEEQRRENNRKLVENQKEYTQTVNDLIELDWIYDFEIKISKVDNIETKAKDLENKFLLLNSYLENLFDIDSKLEKFKNIEEFKQKIDLAVDLLNEIASKFELKEKYGSYLLSLTNIDKEKDKFNLDFGLINEKLNLLINIEKDIEKNYKDFRRFDINFGDLMQIDTKKLEIEIKIEGFIKKLPEICPICGNFIKKDKLLESI